MNEIHIGNVRLKTISGRGKQCESCEMNSATLYELRIAEADIVLCPICLSNLRNALDKNSERYDGY